MDNEDNREFIFQGLLTSALLRVKRRDASFSSIGPM